MKISILCFFILAIFLNGCQKNTLDDLNSIKKEFTSSIVEENIDESPFHMDYSFRTVLFSKDLVSLFGELFVYNHLPHGYTRYEGKTYCKISGKLKEITLTDLFKTATQKEFLRNYCEKDLKNQPISHLSGEPPLETALEQKCIKTFVIDDKFLIIVFQPYTVGGCSDGPIIVKIPYEHLEGNWEPNNPIARLLPAIISSGAFLSSWKENR